jgi:hypothetical protein
VSRKHPKWQLRTPAPMPEPPPSTPVAADDEQMAELMQLMGADAGPRMITAALADATPLDIEARRQLLSGYSLRPTIRAVSTLYARLDAGAEKAADAAIERQFLQSAPGDIAAGAAKALNAGHKLMPPASLTQLTREAIEWCALDDENNESLGPEGGDAALTNEDLLHLVVSINTEHDTHPAFPSGEPTDEQLQQYNDELAGDEEELFAEASRQMLWEFARLQANAITLPVQVLGETHETWFKGWPDKVSRDLVGDAPPDAFEMATGVTLRDFIKLGLHLYEASNVGASAYTRSSLLTPGIDAGVVKRLLAEASLPIDKYRKRLAAERKKGDLMHRWYTFAERPILQLSDDEYLVLRPAWLLGRCCGPQLYWDTFFNLGMDRSGSSRTLTWRPPGV